VGENFLSSCSILPPSGTGPVPSAVPPVVGRDLIGSRFPIPDSQVNGHAADAADAGVLAEDSAAGDSDDRPTSSPWSSTPGTPSVERRSAIGDRRLTASIRCRQHEQLSDLSLPIFRSSDCPADTTTAVVGYRKSALSFKSQLTWSALPFCPRPPARSHTFYSHTQYIAPECRPSRPLEPPSRWSPTSPLLRGWHAAL